MNIFCVAAIRVRDLRHFDAQLTALSQDSSQPVALRIAALECLAPRRLQIAADSFALLTSHLNDDVEPLLRAAAARTLGTGRLDEQQLLELAPRLAGAGSLLVPLLLPAYHNSRSPQVGLAMVEALGRSPGMEALTTDELDKLLKVYPLAVSAAARPLIDKLVARREEQAAYLSRVTLHLLQIKGDPQRGRDVFFSKKAACAGCHRMGDQGGSVGPDLSQIGRLRSTIDLLESVIFPSSSIALGYRSYAIATAGGQVHTGIIVRESSDAIFLRTSQLAEIRIPRAKVEVMNEANISIMPQGLEMTMSPQELSDLLEFLFHCR